MNSTSPIAVPEVRPVLDISVVNEDDVLQSASRNTRQLYPRIGKRDIREFLDRFRDTGLVCTIPVSGSLKKQIIRLLEWSASVTPSPVRSISLVSGPSKLTLGADSYR